MSSAQMHLSRREQVLRGFFDAPLHGNRYVPSRVIGEGAYGVVCEATDGGSGDKVAVKRIMRVLESYPQAIRILRELKFLRLLKDHENIITVKDILIPGEHDKFDDVYVVQEIMPSDLGRVLKRTVLRPDHVKYLMFQLLRGLHFLHSARVFHRDLKPNNILVNDKCHLRICDFGLARADFGDDHADMVYWTDYVATRWYRAPELIMAYFTNYSTAIDLWSAGCIFAEMLIREPLFPGVNWRHQFELITDVTGMPTHEAIESLRNPRAREVVRSMPRRPRVPLGQKFPTADSQALSLLERMLQFDPSKRPTAQEALSDPYFQEFWSLGFPSANPIDPGEFLFERMPFSQDQMRREFLREISFYHPEIAGENIGSFGGDLFRERMMHVERGMDVKPTTLPEEMYEQMEAEESERLRLNRLTRSTTMSEADMSALER